MGWRILLVNFIPRLWHIRQPMLKLKTHSGFHDLFLKYVQLAVKIHYFKMQRIR
jgi:hypothetical protein